MDRAVLGKGEVGLALLDRESAALARDWRGLERDTAEITGGEATIDSIIEGTGERVTWRNKKPLRVGYLLY